MTAAESVNEACKRDVRATSSNDKSAGVNVQLTVPDEANSSCLETDASNSIGYRPRVCRSQSVQVTD